MPSDNSTGPADGFVPIPRSTYERYRHEPEKLAAANDLIAMRNFDTNEITLGPAYLKRRYGFTHGTAARLLEQVRGDVAHMVDRWRTATGSTPDRNIGSQSGSAGHHRTATGPRPDQDRTQYRDTRQETGDQGPTHGGGPSVGRGPTQEGKTSSPAATPSPASETDFSPEEAFERFWAACIKRGSKKKAREAWLKLPKSIPVAKLRDEHGCDTYRDLYLLAYRRMKVWRDTDWCYRDPPSLVPHVSTWLNRHGWLEQTDAELRGGEHGAGRQQPDPLRHEDD